MILVNGADGIGTGWMTKIPNFNPREIVSNLLRMLEGEEPVDMVPWFKNFRGTIAKLGHQKYVCNGEVSTLGRDRVEITELPVRVWTTGYREDLEKMVTGDEKTGPAQIQEFKDYNTDMTVRMVVKMEPEKLVQAEQGKGLHSFFKLQTTMSTTSMVLFDHMGCLRTYETVEEILKEFFALRLEYYGKRKVLMEGLLAAEAARLSNQARFLMEKCKGAPNLDIKKATFLINPCSSITIIKTEKEMVEDLVKNKFESDPVKEWRRGQGFLQEEDQEDQEGPDYAYLLELPLSSLGQERVGETCRMVEEKQKELRQLQATSKEALWRADLRHFTEALDALEEREADDAKEWPRARPDTLPTEAGLRVQPKVADELRDKAVKAAAAKAKKAIKKAERKTGVNEESEP